MSNADLSSPPVPLLVEGDRLSAAEFERRYHAMPELKKAELIEGVVRMPSPVRLDHHGTPHTVASHWVATYWLATPGTQAATDATVRLDPSNVPQPDVFLFVRPSHGGQARVSPDDYLEGTPELVVEVAASSASLTSTPSCAPTSATASASTSSGASRRGRSTGSSCATASTTGSPPAYSAVRRSPACGSTRRRSSRTTSPASSPRSSAASPNRPTPPSSPS